MGHVPEAGPWASSTSITGPFVAKSMPAQLCWTAGRHRLTLPESLENRCLRAELEYVIRERIGDTKRGGKSAIPDVLSHAPTHKPIIWPLLCRSTSLAPKGKRKCRAPFRAGPYVGLGAFQNASFAKLLPSLYHTTMASVRFPLVAMCG